MTDAARSETAAGAAPEMALNRALGLRDLVLFNLVAVVGLRWLATAAKAGPSAISLWILAAIFFFIPQGLVVTELSSRFPEEGGIYQWTKRALGESTATCAAGATGSTTSCTIPTCSSPARSSPPS